MSEKNLLKSFTDMVRYSGIKLGLLGKDAKSEEEVVGLNQPEPHAYIHAEQKIGIISVPNLVRWLRFLTQNGIPNSSHIASSFTSEVSGIQNTVFSSKEISFFYSTLRDFFRDNEYVEIIYRSLIFQDVISFSIGSIDGKTLELWFKKNSGARTAAETKMIAEAFIDEVLGDNRTVLSIAEMEFLNTRMKAVFGPHLSQAIYVELRFREMLLFKTVA